MDVRCGGAAGPDRLREEAGAPRDASARTSQGPSHGGAPRGGPVEDATATIESLAIDGRIDEEALHGVMARHHSQTRYCHQRRLPGSED